MLKTYFRFFAVCVAACLAGGASAQPYMELLKQRNPNLYEVKASFDAYWKNRPKAKGKGYKPFLRWADFMAPRVYPSGDLTLPSQYMARYMAQGHPVQTPTAQMSITPQIGGVWHPLGPVGAAANGGGSGRMNFLRFTNAGTQNLWSGSPAGGVWHTTNGGTTWATTTDTFANLGASDIAIDPTNSQIMYWATGRCRRWRHVVVGGDEEH